MLVILLEWAAASDDPLLAHAESRGGLNSGERLQRYATGKPITARRYDYLWNRLGEHLPWVKTQQVSTHWIRHSYAAELEDAGLSLSQISRLLGHSSTAVTARHRAAS